MVVFGVGEVDPAAAPLPVTPLRDRYCDALAFGGDPDALLIEHSDTHPLLAAVGIAFAQHRPLVLSPDAIWLTIAQGVAQHVRHHAEAAVAPDPLGRKRVEVVRDAMPGDAAAWHAAVGEFRRVLGDEIGEGRARLFECDFSTSTEVDRTVSQIVLLDAYSPYFSYWMMCICGIPSITLTGTVADWRGIRERIDVIAELDLGFWCRSLVPIADQFVRTADGKPDVAFWRRIYNPADTYGGELITGWITRFYPYLVAQGAPAHRNPMLELAIDEPRNVTRSKKQRYTGPGISSDLVPNSSSRVTVHIIDSFGAHRAIALVGGLVGVTQRADGALQPIAGWHVEPAAPIMSAIVDRIARDHHVVAARPAATIGGQSRGPPTTSSCSARSGPPRCSLASAHGGSSRRPSTAKCRSRARACGSAASSTSPAVAASARQRAWTATTRTGSFAGSPRHSRGSPTIFASGRKASSAA
jgi:hypothetical protein